MRRDGLAQVQTGEINGERYTRNDDMSTLLPCAAWRLLTHHLSHTDHRHTRDARALGGGSSTPAIAPRPPYSRFCGGARARGCLMPRTGVVGGWDSSPRTLP